MGTTATPAGVPAQSSRLAPLLQPVQAFLHAESAAGIMLMISALAALIWANSPAGDSYAHFWHSPVSVGFGQFVHSMSLEHWVNDGLMVIFFVLVGLEIKREMLIGELATIRKAALPIAAAIGGMIVPAGIYLAFNAGKPGQHGWGIPMATDIAFAVGVLTLVGKHVPLPVKVFLLAIAIVDDLGAVLVIAVFYTSKLNTSALAVAAGIFLALLSLNALRVHRPWPYVLLGIGLWAATLASGIHATIAGVLLAFTIPASRQMEEAPYVSFMRGVLDRFAAEAERTPERITSVQSHAIQCMEEASQAVQTPQARIEHALLRPVTLMIVPIFALANAGVDLRSGGWATFQDPVMWGVLLGLMLGKAVGVLGASWLAIKVGIASLPEGAQVRQIVGVGVLCGIGFTMSLFVAQLAFPSAPNHLAATKVGILIASAVSGVIGGAIIATGRRKPDHA